MTLISQSEETFQLKRQIEYLKQQNKELEETIVKTTIEFYRGSSDLPQNKILFCDFMVDWLEYHRVNIEENTYDEYHSVLSNHIYPYFKQKKLYLHEITSRDIQMFYLTQMKKGLSNNSVIRQHSNIFSAFKYAKAEKMIKENPMDDVKRPKASKYIASYYNIEQIEELLKIAKKHNEILLVIMLAVFLGLRRSEIIGLKWECINVSHGTITIKNKATRVKNEKEDKISKKLKTQASYRTLPVPKVLLTMLIEVNKTQKLALKNNNFFYSKDSEFVCLDANGHRIKLDAVTNKFRRLIKKEGLDYIRFHDLRHSCASVLMHLGYSLKQIQEWLGHSNINTTANTYLHVLTKDKENMADNLSQYIDTTI